MAFTNGVYNFTSKKELQTPVQRCYKELSYKRNECNSVTVTNIEGGKSLSHDGGDMVLSIWYVLSAILNEP